MRDLLETVSSRSLVTGLIVLSIFGACLAIFVLGPKNQLRGRGENQPLPIKSLGNRPILQLELARSDQDIELILLRGSIDDNVRDARTGNIVDSFLFIPTYALGLALISVLVARGHPDLGRRLLWTLLIAVAIIAAADWAENAGIERVLRHIEAESRLYPGDANFISYPSMLKWTLIGMVLIMLGVTALIQSRIAMRLFGVALVLPGGLQLYQMILYFRERFMPPH